MFKPRRRISNQTSTRELPWKKNIRLSSIKTINNPATIQNSNLPNMPIKRKLKFYQKHWSWWLSRLAILGLISLIIGFIGIIGIFAYYSRDLPDPNQLVRRGGFATKIIDRNGVELYDVYNQQKRIPVNVEEIPQSLKLATIAIEDKDFYNHKGFDPKGIARGFSRIFTRGRAQGGSTLTQQLVKNVLLTSERSLTRKIREFVLAIQIERKFSKDQILQMYLNETPYGGTAWGIGAASELYFGKKVSELNLIESAILAGLPQAPTSLSPFGANPKAYISRTSDVLRRMKEDNHISNDEYDMSISQLDQVEFAKSTGNLKAGHFVMYVRQLLVDKYGEDIVEGGGLTVKTSLDWDLQQKVQAIVTEEINKVLNVNITNGASLVMNPQTGEILAMVGSRGYDDPDYDGKVNVTLRPRQPGSSIKPITYLSALRKGYTASTMLMDAPTEFPGGEGQPPYKPENYDGKFRGPVLLRESLGNSLNITAVKLLALVGLKDTMQIAYDMGFTNYEPTKDNLSKFGLSFTLGGADLKLIDMVSAYSAFANTGYKIAPIAILEVKDNTGRILEEFKPNFSERVITEEEAWIISDILSDNKARMSTFGEFNSLIIPNHQVAVKTGTTNNKRDNWTIGWSPTHIVGVWVGNNDNSPMLKLASGVTGAAPIWRKIMITSLQDQTQQTFTKPETLIELKIDPISGFPAREGNTSKAEYFIKGTEPIGEDPIHILAKVCRGDNTKLATPILISNGDYDQKEFYVFKESDPLSTDGINRWQQGIDWWLSQPERQNDPRYKYPTEFCDVGGQMSLKIIEPNDKQQINSNELFIKTDPISLKGIRKIEIFINDKLASSISSPPYEDKIKVNDGPTKIKVIAYDQDNNQIENQIIVGINTPWDQQPITPTPEEDQEE